MAASATTVTVVPLAADPGDAFTTGTAGGDALIAWPDAAPEGPLAALVVPAGTTPDPARVTRVSPARDAILEAVAAGAASRAVAWVEGVGIGGAPASLHVATQQAPDVAWHPALVTSGGGLDYESPGAAVEPSGVVDVVWSDQPGEDSTLRLRRIAPGGAPAAIQTIATDHTGGSFAAPKIGYAASGTGTLVVDRGGVETHAVLLRAAQKDVPEAVETLTFSGTSSAGVQKLRDNCSDSTLAEAPSGEAAISMTCSDRHDRFGIYVARRRAGASTFGAATRLPHSGHDEFAPTAVIADDGTVTLVWLHRRSRGSAGVGSNRVDVARAAPGHGFGAPAGATRFVGGQDAPTLQHLPDGRELLGWDDLPGAKRFALLAPDGAAGPRFSLAPRGVAVTGVVADSSGAALVVRRRGDVGGHGGIEAARIQLPAR